MRGIVKSGLRSQPRSRRESGAETQIKFQALKQHNRIPFTQTRYDFDKSIPTAKASCNNDFFYCLPFTNFYCFCTVLKRYGPPGKSNHILASVTYDIDVGSHSRFDARIDFGKLKHCLVCRHALKHCLCLFERRNHSIKRHVESKGIKRNMCLAPD